MIRRTPLKRSTKPLRKMSEKESDYREAERELKALMMYSKKGRCMVSGENASDIHHIIKRRRKDVRLKILNLLLVSRKVHDYFEKVHGADVEWIKTHDARRYEFHLKHKHTNAEKCDPRLVALAARIALKKLKSISHLTTLALTVSGG